MFIKSINLFFSYENPKHDLYPELLLMEHSVVQTLNITNNIWKFNSSLLFLVPSSSYNFQIMRTYGCETRNTAVSENMTLSLILVQMSIFNTNDLFSIYYSAFMLLYTHFKVVGIFPPQRCFNFTFQLIPILIFYWDKLEE